MVNALLEKLLANKKLTKLAKTSDKEIFAGSIFPQYFEDVAQASFVESQNTYTSIFQDKAKYNAIMSALAEAVRKASLI